MSRRHRIVSPPAENRERGHRERIADCFSFFRFCAHRNCRRAQRCEGGADPACVRAFWRHVPEHLKMYLRVGVLARLKGASLQEAAAAAEAAAAEVRREEAAAELEAKALLPPVAQDAPPDAPRARQS
jgi:hypothetical protein